MSLIQAAQNSNLCPERQRSSLVNICEESSTENLVSHARNPLKHQAAADPKAHEFVAGAQASTCFGTLDVNELQCCTCLLKGCSQAATWACRSIMI